MEQIISSQPYYYGASKDAPNTVTINIEMKDRVNEQLLASSISGVMERYRYFMKELVVCGNEYVLADNPRPVVLTGAAPPKMLGTDETNRHLLAFSCEGRTIRVSFFHGLCDGAGIFPLIRSLLYYYCSEYYQTRLSPKGINLIGSQVSPEEMEDPYPESIEDTIEPIGRYKAKPVFQLGDGGLVQTGRNTLFHISIPEEAFMKYTKASDASPATMVSVFLYKAIRQLHQDIRLPIVCGVAMDIRAVLNKPKCHHSVVSQLFLEYKPPMDKMDIQTLSTCSRGMVMLQSQPENIWLFVKNNLSFLVDIAKMPDIASKKGYMRKVVARSMQMDTYKVSYVGKAALGDAEQYVSSIDSCLDISGAGIMVEVNSVHGTFHLSFMQEFAEDVYVKAFLRQLEQEGIPYKADGGVPFQTPGVCF